MLGWREFAETGLNRSGIICVTTLNKVFPGKTERPRNGVGLTEK